MVVRNPQYKAEEIDEKLIDKLPDADHGAVIPVTAVAPDATLTGVLQAIQRDVEQTLSRQVAQAEEALTVMMRQLNTRLSQANLEVERLRQRLSDLEDQNEVYERKLTVLADIKTKLTDI